MKEIKGFVDMMCDYYEDGSCPTPQIYVQEVDEAVIYDADGNPLTPKKVSLGFDLSII